MGRVVERERARYIRIKIHEADYHHLKGAMNLLQQGCSIVKGVNGINCYIFTEYGFHAGVLHNWAFDVLLCKDLIECKEGCSLWKLTKDHFKIEYIIKQ